MQMELQNVIVNTNGNHLIIMKVLKKYFTKREAELDNPFMYKKVMNESLKTHVEKSVRK